MKTRTQEEIVNKIKEWQKTDMFGFKVGDIIEYLEYKNLIQFLKSPDSIKESEFHKKELTRDSILHIMEGYMQFAWDKANNFRGLSASRSMAHYTAWIWLIGDEDKFGDLEDYQYYGKDNLKKICETYGWDSSKWDDNIRSNNE